MKLDRNEFDKLVDEEKARIFHRVLLEYSYSDLLILYKELTKELDERNA